MSDLNTSTIQGKLGSDPEQYDFDSGGQVANVNIATQRSIPPRNDGDDWREETQWTKIKAFGRLADQLMNYDKGDEVNIDGRQASPEAWVNNQGDAEAINVIVAKSIHPAGNRGGDQQADAKEVLDDADEEVTGSIMPEEDEEEDVAVADI